MKDSPVASRSKSDKGPTLPRRRRNGRGAQSRSVALAAAHKLLIENGWGAVTHLAVAEASGLGRTTLYRHWPEPGDLLIDVISAELPSDPLPSQGDLRSDLLAEMFQLRERLLDPDTSRLIATIIERAGRDPVFQLLRQRWHQEGTQGTRDALQRGISSGELARGTDVQDALDELSGPLVARILIAGQALTAKQVERHVDRFLAFHASGGK